MSKPAIQHCLELLSRLSLHSQYRFADMIGLFLRNTPNQISRQTRQNIELCFGQLDAEARQRLYRESIRHTCYAMTELGAVWCWPAERVLARVTSTDICSEFEKSTRGRIILAPHLGSWESLVIWLGRHCEAMILYKRIRNRTVDEFIKNARARSGGTPVPTKKHGLRKLLVELKNGGSLMILPDQRPARNKARIASTFWGVEAPTTTVVQKLCSKVECDVFLATIRRSSPPGEFALQIRPLDHARLAAEETASAAYMNQAIEQLVEFQVEQYQWAYQRFDDASYASLK